MSCQRWLVLNGDRAAASRPHMPECRGASSFSAAPDTTPTRADAGSRPLGQKRPHPILGPADDRPIVGHPSGRCSNCLCLTSVSMPWCTTRDLGQQSPSTPRSEVPHDQFQAHPAEVRPEDLSPRLYDRRQSRPEDSPTFRVRY